MCILKANQTVHGDNCIVVGHLIKVATELQARLLKELQYTRVGKLRRKRAVLIVALVVAVNVSVAACGLRDAESMAAGLWTRCEACGTREVR